MVTSISTRGEFSNSISINWDIIHSSSSNLAWKDLLDILRGHAPVIQQCLRFCFWCYSFISLGMFNNRKALDLHRLTWQPLASCGHLNVKLRSSYSMALVTLWGSTAARGPRQLCLTLRDTRTITENASALLNAALGSLFQSISSIPSH